MTGAESVRTRCAYIHETAAIALAARLSGPVLIELEVGHSADSLVISPANGGQEDAIGRDAAVSRSVNLAKRKCGEGAIPDRSILADQTDLDASVVARDTILLAPLEIGAR